MKKTIASLACIAQLASLSASGYGELLKLALASDSTLRRLSIAEERAGIGYSRSELSRLSPALEAGTGSLSASISGDVLTVAASPSATLGLPGGASIGISSALAASSLGPYAKPSASIGIPLIKGGDDKLVASRKSHNAYAVAKAARERAELELERKLDQALALALKAEASLRSYQRAEAKAARELKRAVDIDGAESGGSAYRALERELRTAARARRDAEASRETALASLRRFFAAPIPPDEDFLAIEFPSPSLTAKLPETGSSYAVAAARAAAGLGRLEAEEAARRVVLGANLGASYALGSEAALASANSGVSGLGLSAGLSASLGDLGLTAKTGLAWDAQSGPGLGLSLSWAPKPRGDRELRDRDDALAARTLELDLSDALAAEAADLAALEAKRRGLEEAASDAEEDLAFAEAELEASSKGFEAGLATKVEVDEARAARDECRARLGAAALDRITWTIEARLLTAGAEAFGEEL